jgi:DNA-binding NarL/FixJ family response regulator
MNKHTAKTRILVVDDHPMVRDWLAQLIDREADLAVCGQAEDAAQTLQAIEKLRPDLVILDLSMEGSHGTELIKDIKTRHKNVLILVLSMHDESLYAERAIRAGACGYITKREGGEKVKQAVRCVLGGDIYVSEKIDRKILKEAATRCAATGTSPIESLSDRELEVFELLGSGIGPSEVADRLHLSVKTVEGYAARIKEKLLLKNARELHRYAVQWNKLGGTVPPAKPLQSQPAPLSRPYTPPEQPADFEV